jgi:hypothetical protein
LELPLWEDGPDLGKFFIQAGGHDLIGQQIVQLRVPPVPRIWGPGISRTSTVVFLLDQPRVPHPKRVVVFCA